jgi:hypothetical protein
MIFGRNWARRYWTDSQCTIIIHSIIVPIWEKPAEAHPFPSIER